MEESILQKNITGNIQSVLDQVFGEEKEKQELINLFLSIQEENRQNNKEILEVIDTMRLEFRESLQKQTTILTDSVLQIQESIPELDIGTIIEQISATIIANIPEPIPGEPGLPGISPNMDEIVQKAVSVVSGRIKNGRTPVKGIDYHDGENFDPQIFIDYIKNNKFKPEDIEGLEQLITARQEQISRRGYLHGGGDTVAAGSNITITTDGNGKKVISAISGSSIASVDLSSQCTGSNRVFTVPANSGFLSLMGSDAPIIYQLNVDYTGSGTTTLTLDSGVNPPSLGATLELIYSE